MLPNLKIERYISYVENYLYAISAQVGVPTEVKVEALERLEAICEDYLKPLREWLEARATTEERKG